MIWALKPPSVSRPCLLLRQEIHGHPTPLPFLHLAVSTFNAFFFFGALSMNLALSRILPPAPPCLSSPPFHPPSPPQLHLTGQFPSISPNYPFFVFFYAGIYPRFFSYFPSTGGTRKLGYSKPRCPFFFPQESVDRFFSLPQQGWLPLGQTQGNLFLVVPPRVVFLFPLPGTSLFNWFAFPAPPVADSFFTCASYR